MQCFLWSRCFVFVRWMPRKLSGLFRRRMCDLWFGLCENRRQLYQMYLSLLDMFSRGSCSMQKLPLRILLQQPQVRDVPRSLWRVFTIWLHYLSIRLQTRRWSMLEEVFWKLWTVHAQQWRSGKLQFMSGWIQSWKWRVCGWSFLQCSRKLRNLSRPLCSRGLSLWGVHDKRNLPLVFSCLLDGLCRVHWRLHSGIRDKWMFKVSWRM